MTWRYIATRLNGDGTETVLDPELPLSDVSITKVLNGPTEFDAAIAPEYTYLLDAAGRPLLDKWSTAIYAEKDNSLRAGGIFVDDAIHPDSGQLDLSVMGYCGYCVGMPYTEANTWPPNPYPVDGIEPMSAVREIWRHLQAQNRGDLGITVDPINTGLLIGKMIAEGEFDTENGPLSFEFEPFLLRWFETFDLGDVMQNLADNTPFDFTDEVSWNDDDTINKLIRIGYPRLGARRTDQRFVMGENVQFTDIDPPDSEYADTVLGLGAGEGAAMIRADVYRADEYRIRRAVSFEQKDARTSAAMNLAAQAHLLARVGVDEVTQIVALPGHVEQLEGIEPGDEVRLVGDTPYRPTDMWVKIQSKTETPGTGGLEFAVNRSDRLA